MKSVKLLALTVLVLLALLTACGGGQTTEEKPAGATQPAETEGGEAEQAGEGEAETAEATPTAEIAAATTAAEEDLNLDSVTEGLSLLKSYKSKYSIHFEGKDAQGQAIENYWDMAEEFTDEPRAKRVVSTTSKSVQGQVTETSRSEFTTIGQTTYVVGQEADGTITCVSVSSSDASPPEQSLSPDMWGGVSGARYVNTETVNGIRAKHYAWKEGSLIGFGWLSGEGETWVAVEGGYVVKQVIEGTGKGFMLAEATDEGTTTVEYEVTDANKPFEIVPPEGCEGPSSDIPVMLDALDKMTLGEMVSYRSPSSFADVKGFYEREMPANGWQASGEPMQGEGFAQLTYSKETRTASIMLSFDASTNETTVIVQVTKQ